MKLGGSSYTDSDYSRSVRTHTTSDTHVTRRAEQKAKSTGKLNPLVDPSADGVIRRSKARFDKDEVTGLWRMGDMPKAIEVRLDTTGSMGGNVDIALKALPDTYGLCSKVLPNYELQLSIGIFGDIQDDFPLCRPKFASSAERLVERLTLLVPERAGGDAPEDPHYGLFGAAYLTDTRIGKYGLKPYDFTISDAPAREHVMSDQLERIFGKEVYEKVVENGHKVSADNLPSTQEIVQDLLTRTHAFFLEVGDHSRTYGFWTKVFGPEHVVRLPSVDYLPHVQAVIVGLTEGALTLNSAKEFLTDNKVRESMAEEIVRSVAHIPIGAQAELMSKMKKPLPKKGDLFKDRFDTWPVDASSHTVASEESDTKKDEIQWL